MEELLDERRVIVAGLATSALSAQVPADACGYASATLNGTVGGDITITWTGGSGGCPGVNVVAPATLRCWEEGLPPGEVTVAVDLRGAGLADLRVSAFRTAGRAPMDSIPAPPSLPR